jgi:hypothetical protein
LHVIKGKGFNIPVEELVNTKHVPFKVKGSWFAAIDIKIGLSKSTGVFITHFIIDDEYDDEICRFYILATVGVIFW